MNLIGYLRIFLVGFLLLIGIVGGVLSVHSCIMNTAEPVCSLSDENDCCCSEKAVSEKADTQPESSCCKTTTAYFNIPVYGIVKLIDINPVLIHCFLFNPFVEFKSAFASSFFVYNSDDPPDKLKGCDILIRIEKFLI